MQRVSDEERMEVAKRLRGIEAVQFDDGELVDCGEVETELCLASDDGAWYRLEDVLRLADLIEPAPERTCRLVEDDENRTACSECGASYLCMSDASYCPDCGAKVIEEES